MNATAIVELLDVPRVAPNPDDDVVIGTALAAHADFIVTGDKAFLSVIRFKQARIVPVHEVLDMIPTGPPSDTK